MPVGFLIRTPRYRVSHFGLGLTQQITRYVSDILYWCGFGGELFAKFCEEADFEEVFLDSTIVRVHQYMANVPKNG